MGSTLPVCRKIINNTQLFAGQSKCSTAPIKTNYQSDTKLNLIYIHGQQSGPVGVYLINCVIVGLISIRCICCICVQNILNYDIRAI